MPLAPSSLKGYEKFIRPSVFLTKLAFALSHFFPGFRIPLFFFAVVVAVSRVIITSHYLSDAVAGAWVAMVTVLFLKKALASMEKRAASWPVRQ